MKRVGLVWRLALILLGVFIVIQLFSAVLYMADRASTGASGMRLPLPDQIASMALLIDASDPPSRDLILGAVNGVGLRVWIGGAPPEGVGTGVRLPTIEAAVRAYLGDPDRAVEVWLTDGPGVYRRGIPYIRDVAGGRVVSVVALADGQRLNVDATGELTVRLLGLPLGFFAAIVGFVIAGLAVLLIVRETLPLARLSRSVERFSSELAPAPLPEKGAPEVRSLIAAVNRMQKRIADLVRNRTLVMGAISHDLRTYLTRFRLRIELFPDGRLKEAAIRDLEDMQAIVEEALAFARLTNETVETTRVDLATVVADEVEVRVNFDKPVTLEGAGGPAIVLGSATALARVAGNLIDNAVAYGGGAEVSVRQEDGAVEIAVADRGPGIPAAERSRIFEPFYRLESSRNREHGGTGLGLTIVAQLVEAMNGTITVEDRSGGGSVFKVRLPAAEQAEGKGQTS